MGGVWGRIAQGPGTKPSSLKCPPPDQAWHLSSLRSLQKWYGSWPEGAKVVATLEEEQAALSWKMVPRLALA